MTGHVMIGAFHDANLAALVRSRLESQGIDVITPFEHTNALRLPFVSGPMKLYVREEDEAAAKALLDEPAIDEDSPELDSEIHGEAAPGTTEEFVCPKCGSNAIRLLPAPLLSSFLSLVLPRYSIEDIPSRWHCSGCDAISSE